MSLSPAGLSSRLPGGEIRFWASSVSSGQTLLRGSTQPIPTPGHVYQTFHAYNTLCFRTAMVPGWPVLGLLHGAAR